MNTVMKWSITAVVLTCFLAMHAIAARSPSGQTADLRMKNSCNFTLWMEARGSGIGGLIPGERGTVRRVEPGEYADYVIPKTGLASTRFWAKYGCDDQGRNCVTGDQMPYYPEGGCPPGGCTPPVDSLFEATWGREGDTTWFDTSQVDGYTLPYILHLWGESKKCDCDGRGNCPNITMVNATGLSLAHCPQNDSLSMNGLYPSVTDGGKVHHLDAVDLRLKDKAGKNVIGCMSPCKKLNYGQPFGYGQNEARPPPLYMCCPTPNAGNCQLSQGCIMPDACRAGPIEKTEYVKAVHRMAPGIYAYSYDDLVGLHACPAGTVIYEMNFCPAGSAKYPHAL
jgi:hypothetical protein